MGMRTSRPRPVRGSSSWQSPDVFATVATSSSSGAEWSPSASRAANTSWDCAGKTVAAKKADPAMAE